MALRFSWDPQKAAANVRKHGIAFPDAATAFGDPLSITIPDPDHSAAEERFLLIGVTATAQLVVIAYSERGNDIRLISAREPTRRERENYEEGE